MFEHQHGAQLVQTDQAPKEIGTLCNLLFAEGVMLESRKDSCSTMTMTVFRPNRFNLQEQQQMMINYAWPLHYFCPQ